MAEVMSHNKKIMKIVNLGGLTLSGNMTLTLETGASSQFTLTCTSTGGPAITVTWTRDNVTITEGTETVLNDLVTAQYTHTLIVSQRLGGLYTCTVANNKPSSDSGQYYVQGMLVGLQTIHLLCMLLPNHHSCF